MICYRDMTFCKAKECCNFSVCPRAYTEDVHKDALEWMDRDGDPLVAYYSRPEELDCYNKPGYWDE